MTTPAPRGSGPFPSWLVVAIVIAVAAMWLVSSVARFANPDRYPIPAELHYLMGMIVTMVGGGTYALSRRKADDPPSAPPAPPRSPDAAEPT